MFLFITPSHLFLLPFHHLNTSYVLIYPDYITGKKKRVSDLNTSYVLIYQCVNGIFDQHKSHLNTSYVLIYRICKDITTYTKIFKYILCSYLSVLAMRPSLKNANLNTSYVLIYQISVQD